MANFVESMGYSLGKVHTGLIAYMCNLYREGRVNVLQSFLQNLNIPVPSKPNPFREWSSEKGKLDLAIFNGEEKKPCIIIEMKIDDHETETQLKRYSEATKYLSKSERMLITLGNGEYYQHRGGLNGFTWIRKTGFSNSGEMTKCRDSIESVRKYLLDTLDDAESPNRGIRKNSRSTTLVSLPIHLQKYNDYALLGHKPGYTKKDTIDKLTTYLKKLYSCEFRKGVPHT